jgi:VanZ family protein
MYYYKLKYKQESVRDVITRLVGALFGVVVSWEEEADERP